MSLSLLTWNVLMHPTACPTHRIAAVCNVVESLGLPDVLCLQECRQWTLDLLWKASWWRDYVWSRDPSKHAAEHDAEYFTVLALKRSSFSKVGVFALKQFPNSVMGRGILTVKAQGQHSEFLFATVHLESPIGAKSPLRPFFEESRRVQAQQSWALLEQHGNGEIMMAGDANWIDEDMGRCPLLESWCDPWEILKPGVDGFTYDAQRNRFCPRNRYRSRLDRVWCRLKEWRAVDIKLVGEEKISGIVAADFKDFGEHKPILPSDHFGIFVTFQKQS